MKKKKKTKEKKKTEDRGKKRYKQFLLFSTGYSFVLIIRCTQFPEEINEASLGNYVTLINKFQENVLLLVLKYKITSARFLLSAFRKANF